MKVGIWLQFIRSKQNQDPKTDASYTPILSILPSSFKFISGKPSLITSLLGLGKKYGVLLGGQDIVYIWDVTSEKLIATHQLPPLRYFSLGWVSEIWVQIGVLLMLLVG